ncbi:MAG: hypothetical protein KJO09_03195 [Gammaproteobacteria bacterium]|nr:hypothetical protein [Gammaproteobacteria bacterium]
MNVFFFVVCIVAIVMTADTIQKYMKMKNTAPPLNAPDVEETLEKMTMLEERIRVLERIVTENKYDLKREIDKL